MINADHLHDAEQLALGRLAEMDLALAARMHSLAMTAEDPQEIAAHVRGYHRASRCVRQTIMLRSRLRRDHDRHALAMAAGEPGDRPPPGFQQDRIDARIEDLQDAAARIVAQAAPPGTPRAERAEALDRIDAWIDVEVEREGDDFGVQPLDDHVVALCRAFNLPEHLARRFRDLPRAECDMEDDDADDDSLADTG